MVVAIHKGGPTSVMESQVSHPHQYSLQGDGETNPGQRLLISNIAVNALD